MRRVLLVLLVSVIGATMMTGVARAGVMDFTDDFNTLDEARWSKGDHNLGRSYLNPANVTASGGSLRVKLPARTTNGGELLSDALYGHGSYTARMQLPNAPSSITGFFLYQAPDYASEIDIEIYNDSSRRIMFSTYAGGKQTHTETLALPFDPTAGFHNYRFDHAPGSVKFYADNVLMKEWTDGLPETSMRLYVNAWFPNWLEGRKPTKDKYLLVDSIRYHQQ